MATATVNLISTSYVSGSNNQFSITFSESASGLASGDFQKNGASPSINYTYSSGNTAYLNFSTQVSPGTPGYIRFVLPANAISPNLDEDLDWTIYWGADNVLRHGATAAVRASRITSTLNRVRWLPSRGSGGQVCGVEFEFAESVSTLSADEIELTGDITEITGVAFYIDRLRYRGTLTLPSSLEGGGSVRIRITDLESVYPGLSESVDWTLSWDESGNLTASATADLPIEITASLNIDYVAAGEELFLTLRYSKDGLPVPIDDISLVDGMTIQASGSPNNQTWIYRLTAPATGKGVGVISIPEDVILPGNNAVTIQFTYIDSINAEITLFTPGIENGGVAIVQFDFNYDLPNFSEDFISLNNPNATLGTAEALDPDNRCWVVPVTVPQSGEGLLEISLPEDAIGFVQAAVMAQIQYAPQRAPSIMLNIDVANNFRLLPTIGREFEHEIGITGNNISTVEVRGLLRPFYYDWKPNNGNAEGKLFIRSQGVVDSFYEIPRIDIYVTDADDTASRDISLEVVKFTPVIDPPDKLQFVKGHTNRVIIPVRNFPQEGSVEGNLFGMNHSVNSSVGIIIEGDIPSDRDANFSVNRGDYLVHASSGDLIAQSKQVPWEIVSPSRPTWNQLKSTPYSDQKLLISRSEITDRYVFEEGRFSINLNSNISMIPFGTVTGEIQANNFYINAFFDEETLILSGDGTSFGGDIVHEIWRFTMTNTLGAVIKSNVYLVSLPATGPHAIPTPAVKTNFRNGRTGVFAWRTLPDVYWRGAGRQQSAFNNEGHVNRFFENIGVGVAQDVNIYNIIGLPEELYNPDFRIRDIDPPANRGLISFRNRLGVFEISTNTGVFNGGTPQSRMNLYNSFKGDYNVQLTMTNPKGTATTPTFTMRFQ